LHGRAKPVVRDMRGGSVDARIEKPAGAFWLAHDGVWRSVAEEPPAFPGEVRMFTDSSSRTAPPDSSTAAARARSGQAPPAKYPEARLFPESKSTALRTAIGRACRAAGVPEFSPHDLRHRRVSVLHLQGMPWARIGEHVGQRDLKTTADTYTHVLVDETEVDYGLLLEAA
jgi:integrase